MKQFFTALFLLMAIVLTGLPIQAQSRTASGPGTSAYYNDDDVLKTVVKEIRVSKLEYIHVGGDPQVKGGLYNIAPGPDEEDVPLQKEMRVATLSAGRVLYIGMLPTVLENGTVVMVRQRKKTAKVEPGKLIAIVNCGNWAREFGGSHTSTLEKPDTIFKDCEPKPGGMQLVSDNTVGNTQTQIYSDGCKTRELVTITNTTPGDTKYVCAPGSFNKIFQSGNSQGKVSGPKFKADQAIPSKIRDQVLVQVPELRNKDVQFLQILQGACDVEKDKFEIVWFVEGKGSFWKPFFLGLGAGIIIGLLIPTGSADCPVPTPVGAAKDHTTASGTGTVRPVNGVVTVLGGTSTTPVTTTPGRPRRIL